MTSLLRKFQSIRQAIFPTVPKTWPKYAEECGWAPKPDNPDYPFVRPPAWNYRVAQGLGAFFWFVILMRFKEDGAHEILGIHPWDDNDEHEDGGSTA